MNELILLPAEFRAQLSPAPVGVPTRRRSPITAQHLAPSLCGQPVKGLFCVQGFVFLFFFFFPPAALHGATSALNRWTD